MLVSWHDPPHEWRNHLSLRPPRLICLLQIGGVSTQQTLAILTKLGMTWVKETKLVKRQSVCQTLHYGVEEARVSRVHHTKAHLLTQLRFHHFLKLVGVCVLDLTTEVILKLLSLFSLNLELASSFIWNGGRLTWIRVFPLESIHIWLIAPFCFDHRWIMILLFICLMSFESIKFSWIIPTRSVWSVSITSIPFSHIVVRATSNCCNYC